MQTHTNNEMALQANTVNLDTSALELLDEILCSSALISRKLDVIIVVIQLNTQSILLDCLLSRRERHWYVFLADGIVPDIAGIAAGWIVREGLVHNIPAVAVVAKVLYELCHVVLEYFREACLCPVLWWIGDPVGKLVGPDEVVAANFLASGFSELYEVVATCEVEDVLFWFCVYELHKFQLILKPID